MTEARCTVIMKLIIAVFVLVYSAQAISEPDRRVSEDKVYTLYRSNPYLKTMRVHVATFDADEERSYNQENCEKARELFQAQPEVKVRYWCEKGYFAK